MRKSSIGLLILLALFGARLLHTAWAKSLTPDEPHYIGTGLYLWESGDYHHARSLRFHPPLAFHLAALPLLAFDLEGRRPGPSFGGELVHGSDPDPDAVRMAARAPFVLVACWGAVLLFLWAREAAGPAAALLAVLLTTFSPTVLAHGALAHSDILVTVLVLQTLYLTWRWLRRPGALRLGLLGLSLGLAVIAKASALLFAPVVGAAILWGVLGAPPAEGGGPRRADRLRAFGRALGAGLAVAVLVLAVVWVGYGFSFALEEDGSGLRLPAYLNALRFDVAANARGRPIYFFGEVHDAGRWYFLPAAFLLKTPLGTLVLLALSVFAGRRVDRRVAGILGGGLALYLAVACLWLRVPLGLRYLLPVIPLLHLWIGVRLAPWLVRRAAGRAVLAAACTAVVAASLWIHPHHLAFFHVAAGGPGQGSRFLVESNLDWGQDLRTLAGYLHARGNPPVWLAFFGVERPARYGLRTRPLPECRPVTGLVAISANVLREVYSHVNPMRRPPEGCYAWLRAHEPVAKPGYSIFVYEIDEAYSR